jgi:hypothetical protein
MAMFGVSYELSLFYFVRLMTGKLKLQVKNCHARLKQMRVNCLSPALTDMAPLCRRLYPGNDYILQQDGATSHTSRVTQEHLREETTEFIKKYEWSLSPPILIQWTMQCGIHFLRRLMSAG